MARRPSQEAALKMLQDALGACFEAGICLVGMDDTLYAYRRSDLQEAGYFETGADRLEALRCTPCDTIEDHGAYLDSGGW